MKKIFTLAFLLFLFSRSWGQAGSLNRNFNGGTVNTAFDISGSLAEDLVIQSDKKIVAAGLAYSNGIAHFAMARYLINGTLDGNFGVDGKVLTLINGGSWAHALAIQADGKIIVAGYAENGNDQDFALARYHQNGSLDHSFGVGGKVTTDISNSPDEIYDIDIQPDGKIIAGGRTYNGTDYDFVLVRYLPDGNIDMSFSGGKMIIGVGPGNDFAQSLQIQPDRKILLAGTSFNGKNYNMAVIRVSENGVLDAGFGSGGQVFTAVGPSESYGFDIALQPDGKIVFTGHTYSGLPNHIDIALVRYTTSGATDPTFGINGIIITDISNTNDDGIGVAVQKDGKIIVAGHTMSDGYKDFLLLRYLPNGAPDVTFGAEGRTTTPVGNYDDIAYSVKLSGMNIYVAGISNLSPNGVPGQFALAAFINDATPLPVNILSFTAEKTASYVSIRWQTAREDQLKGFNVERSADGNNFQKINEVPVSPFSIGTKNYTALDREPLSTINYYRLKLLDTDGSHSFSKVIALRNNDQQKFQVSPNPVVSFVQVQLPSGISGVVTIEIVEISGRVLHRKEVKLTGNAAITNVDLANVPHGVYIIRALSSSATYSQKIVKL